MTNRTKEVLSYILIFLTLFICIYNIFHYDPLDSYDGEAHYQYVDYFSRYLPYKIELPTDNDSREFFNPPLGYLVPSVAQVVCRNLFNYENFLEDCKPFQSFALQIFQMVMYILTIFINLKTIQVLTKSNKLLNFEYLLIISLFAVNYKTIVMIRGEPYILFFMSILLYLFIKSERKKFQVTTKDILYFGLVIGMLALSRQWSFLLFPAFFLLFFVLPNNQIKDYTKYILGSFLIGFLTSSWFYFSLFFRYGSFTTFNKDPIGFSLLNQPLNFYIPNLSDLYYVFYKPIRPYFGNQFLSTLYSDFWGDYWGYFSFTSRELDAGRNQMMIGDYLARVNIVSLLITFFLLFSIYKVRKYFYDSVLIKYILLSIFISFLGYLWFLISFPVDSGDTNKATYIIQMFNLIGLVAALVLNKLKENKGKVYEFMVFYFLFAYIHNFSSYLSHFPLKTF